MNQKWQVSIEPGTPKIYIIILTRHIFLKIKKTTSNTITINLASLNKVLNKKVIKIFSSCLRLWILVRQVIKFYCIMDVRVKTTNSKKKKQFEKKRYRE